MKHHTPKSSEEILEKRILLLSFLSGVGFVIVELIYAVYSHSQSTLMDSDRVYSNQYPSANHR